LCDPQKLIPRGKRAPFQEEEKSPALGGKSRMHLLSPALSANAPPSSVPAQGLLNLVGELP